MSAYLLCALERLPWRRRWVVWGTWVFRQCQVSKCLWGAATHSQRRRVGNLSMKVEELVGMAKQDFIPVIQRAAHAKTPFRDTGHLAEDLEDFFENAAVGLHVVAGDGTILRANRAELD